MQLMARIMRRSCGGDNETNQPMNTVLDAITVPFGASAGSLHVMAGSPILAAGLSSRNTVELPSCTVALLAGDF